MCGVGQAEIASAKEVLDGLEAKAAAQQKLGRKTRRRPLRIQALLQLLATVESAMPRTGSIRQMRR